MDAQRKRSVITAFNGVVRTSALKDHDVGQQQLAILLDHLLDDAGDAAVDLGPVYEHLKARGVEDDPIGEALLAFREREDTLGVVFSLPPPLAHLSNERKQRLLARYHKRQRPSRTATPPPGQSAAKSAAATGATQPVPAPSPPAQLRSKVLAAALVGVVLLAAGFFVWRAQTAEPAPVAVVIDDPMALPCDRLEGNQTTLVCWMSQQTFTRLGPAERDARGKATRSAGKGLGYSKVLVLSTEDRRVRAVY